MRISKERVEKPLEEVRRWKREVSLKTKNMSTEKVIKYFREGADAFWKEHGYKCVTVGKGVCKYTKG